MNINMEYYRVFYYVAKLGSMTQAAYELNTDQPNVSRIIKRMEDESGFKLFLRSGKKLILTNEGEIVYSKIKGAVERITEVEAQLDSTRDYLNHNVAIACSGIATHYIEPILSPYKKAHPELTLKFLCYTSNEVLSMLNEETIDIGFAVLTDPIPPQFIATPIYDFRDVLTVGSDYEYLTKKKHHLKDLEDLEFVILPKNTQTFEFFASFCKSHDFHPKASLEVTRSDHVSLMLLHNWGVSFLPDFVVNEVNVNIPLYAVELYEELPKRTIYMITKQGHPLSPVTKEIISLFPAKPI